MNHTFYFFLPSFRIFISNLLLRNGHAWLRGLSRRCGNEGSGLEAASGAHFSRLARWIILRFLRGRLSGPKAAARVSLGGLSLRLLNVSMAHSGEVRFQRESKTQRNQTHTSSSVCSVRGLLGGDAMTRGLAAGEGVMGEVNSLQIHYQSEGCRL
jgi:hypothetical protein